MYDHFQLSDKAFEQQFASLQLNPALFSHEAHLRLAWIHVTRYGIDQAIENVTNQIKAFAEHHGAHGKYHTTVTIAAVRAVYHFVIKSDSANFKDFITEFPQLKNEFTKLLASHYSTDIFKSTAARESFLEPDLAPFD